MEAIDLDDQNGVKFTWNTLPSNRTDSIKLIVPPGFHITPAKKIENLQILEYDPLTCNNCKSILSSVSPINFRNKSWDCTYCGTVVKFPSSYAQFISETNLPAEMMAENNTVEYKLSKKESNYPTFIFVIDISVEEDELNELKESIQTTLSSIPQECNIGIITFGNMCHIHEIGYSEFPISHTLKGEKHYKTIEIQELLGLATVNRAQNLQNQQVFNAVFNKSNKFIAPLSECSFALNSLLDDLQPDYWQRKEKERPPHCGGLALLTAQAILEAVCQNEPARILFFLGNAPSIGQGQVAGKSLTEYIRLFSDLEKGNPNTKFVKLANEYYEAIANKSSKMGHVIDVFSCCLNQVGLYEMKHLTNKTGGVMLQTDSFSTLVFRNTIRKLFELDEYNNLKMNFKSKLELFTSDPIKISGAMGKLVSMGVLGKNVSDQIIAEGNTRQWALGGMDQNSTYSFLLDINNTTNQYFKQGYIQIQTTYIAGDRSHRLRVTTVAKKFIGDLDSPPKINQMGEGFDQDASIVMMARLSIIKGATEESKEILRWLDKSLIRLITKFAKYKTGETHSFKLTPQFSFFPQYIFYLRRSYFIQNFNSSPDEITYYKSMMMHECVMNATIMIQPLLFAYGPEELSIPQLLEVESMKNDHVLLLDAFFFIVVWHGEDVCKWRDDGYHLNPEYENIKFMLETPQEYAQEIINDRTPVPRFVNCDSGSGQERLLKFTLNFSNSGIRNKVIEDGFCSDDVTLKVFMDYLVKLVTAN
jgi:protein transport protein SEC23